MSDVHRFRMAMVKYLGQSLTPEVAAAIEAEAFHVAPTPIQPGDFEPAQCGSTTFAVERFIEVLDELKPLHDAHYAETERHRLEIPLRPDYDAYLAEDRAGTMVQITARREGRLVGQLRLYLRRSRHTQTLLASEDALFLLPEARGARTAKNMAQYAEWVLWQLNVREVRATAKLVNGAARFLEGACDFKPVATELVKFLTEPPTKPGGVRAACVQPAAAKEEDHVH